MSEINTEEQRATEAAIKEADPLDVFMEAVGTAVDMVKSNPGFNVQRSFSAVFLMGRAYDQVFRLMLQKMRGSMLTQSGAASIVDSAIKTADHHRKAMLARMEGFPFWLGELSTEYQADVLRLVTGKAEALGWPKVELGAPKRAREASRIVSLGGQ
jgi:hypothetical protein